MSNTKDPKILINQAKQGDKDAFGTLFGEFYTPVFRYIYSRTSSKELSEDLAQQTFLKIYQGLEKFEIREVSPLAYFFTVARNLIIDHSRKKSSSSLDEVSPEAWSVESDSNKIANQFDIGLIKQTLHQLPEDQQEVIRLRFITDLSHREVAKILNKTETAVRQLQCRAIKTLKQLLS